MGIINILDTQTANMIAAGEVVDRPASALKELLENALDAEATKISVDIKGGGRAFLRVTDNGKGFYRDDMPKALLRHATSKIAVGEDLNAIATFGFRGEALAAISSVSHMEIISRQRTETVGTRLTSDEFGVVMSDTGCPEGTSVIVRDLFYNTPARQKFLKRDVAETSACVSVAERAAIARPDISFTVTVDGERRFYTPGDGKLLSVLHTLYGKAFANGLVAVEYELEGVHVAGYVSTPDNARGSRSMQMFYVNERPIRSKTIMAALEEAFRSYLPHGKYPAAVLFVNLQCGLTDVNVHPAKLEIRFADERKIFSAVYYAVKNELNGKPEEQPSDGEDTVSESHTGDRTGQQSVKEQSAGLQTDARTADVSDDNASPYASPIDSNPVQDRKLFQPVLDDEVMMPINPANAATVKENEAPVAESVEQIAFENKAYWKYIGEAYDAFLFFETAENVYVVDKHAAHERILYEKLVTKKEVHAQELLSGIPIDLTGDECAVLLENASYLEEFGFQIEPFGSNTVLVRAVPSSLAGTKQLDVILQKFASDLAGGSNLSFAEKCDRALYTVACKAAVKAGIPNDKAHNEWIIQQLMDNEKIRFCPHGRPVMHALPKKEIEKYFDR